jgi:type IV pilus assembly protein PilV
MLKVSRFSQSPTDFSFGFKQPLKKTQTGITLIEVLVSILLMSFALLGMAALQAESLSQQVGATTRANLSSLTSDIADRMRSNLSRSPGYNTTIFTPTFAISTSWSGQATVVAVPSPDCAAAVCTAAERETYDLATWRRKVRAELPQGSALISGSQLDNITVTLMWFDKDYRSGGILRTTPPCTAAMTAGAAQTCCPSVAAAPAGVRCNRTTLLP